MQRVQKMSVFIVMLLLTVVLIAELTAAGDNRQAAALSGSDKKQVLLLNSYHHGMEWVNEIEVGIRSVFDDPSLYNLNIDFMDAKRNFSAAYMQKTLELFQEKYKDKKFDAIIVTDDNAYEFVLRNQQLLFPATPIVFLLIHSTICFPYQFIDSNLAFAVILGYPMTNNNFVRFRVSFIILVKACHNPRPDSFSFD